LTRTTRDLALLLLCGAASMIAAGVLLVAGLLAFVWPAREPAAAVTLRVAAAGDGLEGRTDGEASLRQAARTIEQALVEWNIHAPHVSIVDPEERLLRFELPGVDSERLSRLLADRAELEFKLVANELGPLLDPEEARKHVSGGLEVACERPPAAPSGERPCYLLVADPVIVGADLRSARPGLDDDDEPGVVVRFSETASERLHEFSAEHVGQRLAILVDGEVITAPRLDEPIPGEAFISGGFSLQEVEELALRLRASALPTLSVVGIEPVPPGPGLHASGAILAAAGLVLAAGVAGVAVFTVRLLRARGGGGQPAGLAPK
jgi:preprotein translocase subunit SecD